MAEPQRGVAYEFSLTLVDAANPVDFKTSPTLAAGDVQISIDNAAFSNLATLPVIEPAGSVAVKVNLSVAEMTGDKIMIWFKDVAGAEWGEAFIFLDVPIANTDTIYAGIAAIPTAVVEKVLTESYAAKGAAPTLEQALLMTMQRVTEAALSGSQIIVKELDGSTTAYTLDMNDPLNPSSSTRA